MIEIIKNGQTKMVTAGAFIDIFQPNGWKENIGPSAEIELKSESEIIDMRKIFDEEVVPVNEEYLPENDLEVQGVSDEISMLEEKPVSELTTGEIKKLAIAKGIDISGKSKKEVKSLLIKALKK